jgi:hypothetical protein
MACSSSDTSDISEEHTASIFRIEAARMEGKNGRPQEQCEIFVANQKPEREFICIQAPRNQPSDYLLRATLCKGKAIN